MQPGVEIGHAAGDVRRNPEHRLGAVAPGQLIGGQVEVPDSNARGRSRQPERLFVEGELRLALDLFGDVVALGEDAGDLAIVVEDRLIDEIQIAAFQRLARLSLKVDGSGGRNVGSSGRVGLIEQLKKALAFHLREDLANWTSNYVAPPAQAKVTLVAKLEDVLGPPHHRHETWSLFEQPLELVALASKLAVESLNRAPFLIQRLGLGAEIPFCARSLPSDGDLVRGHGERQVFRLGRKTAP